MRYLLKILKIFVKFLADVYYMYCRYIIEESFIPLTNPVKFVYELIRLIQENICFEEFSKIISKK